MTDLNTPQPEPDGKRQTNTRQTPVLGTTQKAQRKGRNHE